MLARGAREKWFIFPILFNGMATSTMSPNAAASCGEPALQPIVLVRLNNVSGPRVFDTITSWPCLIATEATARAINPAPMVPIFMAVPFFGMLRGSRSGR